MVKLDLVLQTVLLFLMAGADSAVGRHAEMLQPNGLRLFIWWNLNNISGHNKTSMFAAHVLMSSITWMLLL